MLRDRKVLVESEITKLTDTAAHQYFDAVRGEIDLPAQYDQLCERITKLQHERKMIQTLLDLGHE